MFADVPDHWQECTVAGVAAKTKNALVGGPFGSNLVSADYVAEGVPVIRGQNMGVGRWVDGEFAFVSPEKAKSLSANWARPGDLVFTQRGTLGQVAIIPNNRFDRYVVSQSQMKLTVDETKADALFLYYVFSSAEQQDHIRRNTIQTGVPHTNLETLKTTTLSLPPLAQQKAIAHILGTLDDKIELNRRMNETLEAMARALFKSWFVDFEPVRAKMDGHWKRGQSLSGLPANLYDLFPNRLVDSELGEIPEGWSYSGLGNLIELAYGRGLKEQSRCSGSIPVYGSNGQVGWHNAALVKGPGVVVGRKGNPGTVTWVPTDFFPIDTTFYVVPKGRAQSMPYLFYALSLLRLPLLAADSAVPGLNRSMAYISKVLQPPAGLVRQFDLVCAPLLASVHSDTSESRTLSALRDTFLPKLVSGGIRVPRSLHP